LDECLAFAYLKETRLRPTIVRFFNIVGPRQTGRYGMVLPRFVGQALRQEPLRVFGDGSQIRCFCHVADTVTALLRLASAEDCVGEIFNIGSPEPISIQALAERVIHLTGSRSTIQRIPYDQAYGPGFEDMYRRVPGIEKIHRFIGWAPTRSLDETIRDLVAEQQAAPAP
jgi:UDP-glucose 4-epimerase